MQISISGHHVDVTDSMKNYVEEKMQKLERHFDHVVDIHVILTVEKLRQKAEATVHVNGAKLFADAIEEDMYAAIDALIDKLDRQVVKHKEKLTEHRR
jgi:putative sigma-54 modulation protein